MPSRPRALAADAQASRLEQKEGGGRRHSGLMSRDFFQRCSFQSALSPMIVWLCFQRQVEGGVLRTSSTSSPSAGWSHVKFTAMHASTVQFGVDLSGRIGVAGDVNRQHAPLSVKK